jgi:hypothetical protein
MTAMAPGPARDELYARLEQEAAPLVDAGAETLVPAGGLPCVAFPAVEVCGRPFLNIVGVAARATRSRAPAQRTPPPPAALAEFLDATGGPLREPLR